MEIHCETAGINTYPNSSGTGWIWTEWKDGNTKQIHPVGMCSCVSCLGYGGRGGSEERDRDLEEGAGYGYGFWNTEEMEDRGHIREDPGKETEEDQCYICWRGEGFQPFLDVCDCSLKVHADVSLSSSVLVLPYPYTKVD